MNLFSRPLAFSTAELRKGGRGLLSPLNLHWAGVGLLALVNLYLLIHMGVAAHQVGAQDSAALAAQQTALTSARLAARPLQGLDAKLKRASDEADQFSLERLPVSYSEVATELGDLAHRDNVRLTRVQYAQAPVAGGQVGGRAGSATQQLTQVQMDAGLSGDYRGLMLFINGLERDRTFFLINSVTLTGQQTGVVNLRIRIVTYLRGPGSDEDPATYQIAPPSENGKPSADVVDPDAPPPAPTLGGIR